MTCQAAQMLSAPVLSEHLAPGVSLAGILDMSNDSTAPPSQPAARVRDYSPSFWTLAVLLTLLSLGITW